MRCGPLGFGGRRSFRPVAAHLASAPAPSTAAPRRTRATRPYAFAAGRPHTAPAQANAYRQTPYWPARAPATTP